MLASQALEMADLEKTDCLVETGKTHLEETDCLVETGKTHLEETDCLEDTICKQDNLG
jgi:hypothetical protein